MVFAADWYNFGVGHAGFVSEVVAHDADTLAEDVVIDLVDGAGDGGGGGTLHGRSVGAVGGEGGAGGVGSPRATAAGVATAVYIGVGLAVEYVYGVIWGGDLRVKQYHQER